ncbi:hypothetical protein ACVBEH_07280, partial [Roseateles sp. GG27B]
MRSTLLSNTERLAACFIALLAGMLLALPAQAANYTLPGNLPPGCSGSNGDYVCAAALTLAAGDTVTVASPTPATLRIGGALTLSNQASINAGGVSSDLILRVAGNLDLGTESVIRASINATSISNSGKSAVLDGSVTTVGAIQLDTLVTASGSITTSAGAITLGQGSVVGGSANSNSGAVVLGDQTQLGGSVSTSAAITLGQSSIVRGSLTSASGAISLQAGAQVMGNIGTEGAIDVGSGSKVGGAIYGGAGAVTVNDDAVVNGAISTHAGGISLGTNSTARACVQSTDSAAITLSDRAAVNSVCCGTTCSNSCVFNNSGRSMPSLCSAKSAFDHFNISGAGAASTCAPQTLTLSARDNNNNVLSSYTGSAEFSTSSGRGNWQIGNPNPAGVFIAGTNNSGLASYSFAAADQGVVVLSLSHSLAQNVTVKMTDSTSYASSSGVLQFRDNAFVWAEDLANLISGSGVAVVGRPHDLQVTLIKKDPSSGSCGAATDYSGSRNLKLWRSDNGGSWAAPALVAPTLSSVPAARPSTNNLSLSFNAGVASLTLASIDIGKYSLTLEDDSLMNAAATVVGSLPDLTVRPFTLVLSNLSFAGTANPNPNGSAANDASFGSAGGNFSATLAAYRWSSVADANNDGMPDASATLVQVTAGGLTSSFNSTSTLTPSSGSQTPASGVLGQLLNGNVNAFTGGSAALLNLQYSEVGSFVLNGSGWVSNFLATSGLNLDGLVFNASGAQNARVGRFVPADFALSAGSVVNRV